MAQIRKYNESLRDIHKQFDFDYLTDIVINTGGISIAIDEQGKRLIYHLIRVDDETLSVFDNKQVEVDAIFAERIRPFNCDFDCIPLDDAIILRSDFVINKKIVRIDTLVCTIHEWATNSELSLAIYQEAKMCALIIDKYGKIRFTIEHNYDVEQGLKDGLIKFFENGRGRDFIEKEETKSKIIVTKKSLWDMIFHHCKKE